MARRMADDDFRSWQWEHRYDPQVREINKLVNDLVKERPRQKVPYVASKYKPPRPPDEAPPA